MSVRLFHPMVAPHIQQVARALHEAGELERFQTSIRADSRSRTQRVLCAVARAAGQDLARELTRRSVTEVPLDLVTSRPWAEALRIAVARLAGGQSRLHDWTWERAETHFDRGVARGLHGGLTGVYGYEFSSLATFRRARALGLRVAYDLPSLDPDYVQRLLESETAKFPSLETPFHRWVAAREPERLARRRAEFATADLVLANSKLTRDSYAAAGLDSSKVRVLHLGAPPCAPRDEAMNGGSTGSGPLTLLWAGTFGVRKGAHYLLEAWRKHQLGRHAKLEVYGSVGLPAAALQPLPDGIEFKGAVPRAEVLAAFHRADALLFPTLCDGFGMVATEAWSRGLPVLATDRAGSAELLAPERNGLLIAAASADAIAGAIDWCHTHRTALQAMRETALATAARWQWSDYRQALARELRAAGLFSRADE